MNQQNNNHNQNYDNDNYNSENYNYRNDQNYNNGYYGNPYGNNGQVQESMINRILYSDTSQNNLFLKIIFFSSLAIFLGSVWLGFKVFKISGENNTGTGAFGILRNILGNGGLNSFTTQLGISVDQGLQMIATINLFSKVHNIFKWTTIILVIVLFLVYLKTRRENTVYKMKSPNYFFALILAGLGIYEIVVIGKYAEIFKNPLKIATSLMSGQVSIPTSDDIEVMKIFFVAFLAVSFLSSLTNYFRAFKNRDFERQDIDRAKAKIFGNGSQQYYNEQQYNYQNYNPNYDQNYNQNYEGNEYSNYPNSLNNSEQQYNYQNYNPNYDQNYNQNYEGNEYSNYPNSLNNSEQYYSDQNNNDSNNHNYNYDNSENSSDNANSNNKTIQ